MPVPGYGPISYFTRSPEERAVARAADAASWAEYKFVKSIRKKYEVYCPDAAKWAALSAADQKRWHDYYKGEKKMPLFGDSDVCYDP